MMKKIQTIALALIVCGLLSPVALANVKTKDVTFVVDVKVGNTLIKKGDYKVTYDESTSELTILDGKKVIAKTTARLEEEMNKSRFPTKYRTVNDGQGNTLLSGVNLGGKFAIIGLDKTAGTPASTGQKP
jgi:hypothetical protein